jgi:hypothetical protein
MANSFINVGESQTPTKKLSTYNFIEDSESKEVQRVGLNDDQGNLLLGISPASRSIPVVLANDVTSNFSVTQLGGSTLDTTGLSTKRTADYASVNRVFRALLSPTIGTPVALNAAAQNTFSGTAPSIIINAGTKPVVLESLSLLVGGAGAGLSSLQSMIVIDTTNRYISGGNAILAKSNLTHTNSLATVRTATTAIVASAAGATTIPASRFVIKSAIPAANDFYKLVFNNQSVAGVSTTNSTRQHLDVNEIVIPANGTCLIYLWGPAQTAAPTYEAILTFME